jgi:hypothetical protein
VWQPPETPARPWGCGLVVQWWPAAPFASRHIRFGVLLPLLTQFTLRRGLASTMERWEQLARLSVPTVSVLNEPFISPRDVAGNELVRAAPPSPACRAPRADMRALPQDTRQRAPAVLCLGAAHRCAALAENVGVPGAGSPGVQPQAGAWRAQVRTQNQML